MPVVQYLLRPSTPSFDKTPRIEEARVNVSSCDGRVLSLMQHETLQSYDATSSHPDGDGRNAVLGAFTVAIIYPFHSYL